MLDWRRHLWRYQTKVCLLDTRVKVYRLKESGLQTPERSTPRVIVSLTSHPPRIAQSYAAVYSLLTQSLKPDKVVLWLAQSQFPCKTHDLPLELLHLRQFGLSIQWCEDLKALKKIIPSLREYPEDIVVLADDDIVYPSDWLKKLYEAYQKEPNVVQAYGAYRKFVNGNFDLDSSSFETGTDPAFSYAASSGLGVLYPPGSLHKDILRTDLPMEYVPYDEQTWCWIMQVLNKTKIHALQGGIKNLIYLDCAGAISAHTVDLVMRFSLLDLYPQIQEILIAEERAMLKTCSLPIEE
jgi:hypothetical protein